MQKIVTVGSVYLGVMVLEQTTVGETPTRTSSLIIRFYTVVEMKGRLNLAFLSAFLDTRGSSARSLLLVPPLKMGSHV
jgi:hypothetical protein